MHCAKVKCTHKFTLFLNCANLLAFKIHIYFEVLREDQIDSPIHIEYSRCDGATTLTFMAGSANTVNAFVMETPISWNVGVPPDNTTLAYKSLRMSTSHFHDALERRVVDSTGLLTDKA